MRLARTAAQAAVPWLAFSWGLCTFFPVGIAYLHALSMLLLLGLSPGWSERWARLRASGLALPMAAFLGWAVVAAAAGPWVEDTPTRLFHLARVVLLLCMGIALDARESRFALLGYLVGAWMAAMLVALHHAWGLPEWDLWGSLLRSRNNFSSGNMIMMATAAGALISLGLHTRERQRWLCWGLALALGVTVTLHALSRNAQVLLVALVVIATLARYRSWRAVGIAGALAAMLAVAAWHLSPATQGRFAAVVQEARRMQAESDFTSGVGERFRMAQEAWNGMLESPLLGVGVGSWLPRWREVALATRGTLDGEALHRHVEINNPHNDVLLAGMETGVPGLLTTLWLLLALVALGWRARGASGDLVLVLACSLGLSALINAPLRDAALGMTLIWLTGAGIAASRGGRP